MASVVKTAIVVPVFNAAQALRVCLKALHARLDPSRAQVILIDDASSEPEVAEVLAEQPSDSASSPLSTSACRWPVEPTWCC